MHPLRGRPRQSAGPRAAGPTRGTGPCKAAGRGRGAADLDSDRQNLAPPGHHRAGPGPGCNRQIRHYTHTSSIESNRLPLFMRYFIWKIRVDWDRLGFVTCPHLLPSPATESDSPAPARLERVTRMAESWPTRMTQATSEGPRDGRWIACHPGVCVQNWPAGPGAAASAAASDADGRPIACRPRERALRRPAGGIPISKDKKIENSRPAGIPTGGRCVAEEADASDPDRASRCFLWPAPRRRPPALAPTPRRRCFAGFRPADASAPPWE